MPLSPTKTLVTHVNKVTAKLNNDILTGAYSSYACLLGFNEKEYKSRKAQSFLKNLAPKHLFNMFIMQNSANGSTSICCYKNGLNANVYEQKKLLYYILFYLSSGVCLLLLTI